MAQGRHRTRTWMAWLLGLLIIGCTTPTPTATPLRPTETPLHGEPIPFEVLMNESYGSAGEARQSPAIVLLREPTDLVRSERPIPLNAWPLIQAVDFTKNLVIVIFQGEKDTGGYGVTTEEMRVEGDTLVVYAHFREPVQDEVITLAFTYPFQVLQVPLVALPPSKPLL